MLTTATKEEAARKLGISSRTLRNYLKDTEFTERLETARTNLIHEASHQIQRSLSPSIKALHEIVSDERAGKTARVQAARALLEYGIRLTEMEDICRRLDELEGSIHARRGEAMQ